MKNNNRSRKLAALNAREHRSNVEAAAAADRHAKSFSEMFAVKAPTANLSPSAQYLADLERKAS